MQNYPLIPTTTREWFNTSEPPLREFQVSGGRRLRPPSVASLRRDESEDFRSNTTDTVLTEFTEALDHGLRYQSLPPGCPSDMASLSIEQAYEVQRKFVTLRSGDDRVKAKLIHVGMIGAEF